MLDLFKSFDKDRLSLDELVAREAFGEVLRARYAFHQIEEPEFVDVNLKSLRREIRSRNADRLAARKRALEQKVEGYKTTAEKKAEAKRQLDALNKELAKAGG